MPNIYTAYLLGKFWAKYRFISSDRALLRDFE